MRYSIPVLLIAAFWGCRDDSKVLTPLPNNPPVADAGADQSLSADEAINLDGGGSTTMWTSAFGRVNVPSSSERTVANHVGVWLEGGETGYNCPK